MTPYTASNAPPSVSQIVMVGEIVSATAAQGLASTIKYRVIVHHNSGSTIYEDVSPWHRRPSDDTDIKAAKPGHACLVQDPFGASPRFIIFEGLVTTECPP